ncbi:MAG: Undecaprenyl-phosphate galactose phosphotransferase [Deltaproteobacteria bacterium]|nr:Undecaprenyl-phosphate galactose phosphotransferase [Deltaproteobacteria bacterium]
MAPFAFLEWLNPIRWFRRKAAFHGIHPTERFHLLIERERSRTDRTGIRFSLVVFKLAARKRDTYYTLYHLAGLLTSRARTSDEVGWFDKTSLAVLLIGAGESGAARFGQSVTASLPGGVAVPTISVYVYPTADPGEGQAPRRIEDGTEAGTAAATPPIPEPAAESAALPEGSTLAPVFARQLPLWKDILDVILSLIALILLSPLFLLIAVYIKIADPGPVFFRQNRIGFRGKKFECWKFRTMKVNNDAAAHEEYLKSLIQGGDQAMVKLDARKDPRIIPFGWVLRQSGLDELPQLINVLRGDMSLVGPRPCLPYEAKEYDQWHAERFDTAPGLTGLWQVSGKNRTTFKDMMRFDIRYSRRMSFWMEIQILFKTFPAIAQQIRDHRARARGKPDEGKPVAGKENA